MLRAARWACWKAVVSVLMLAASLEMKRAELKAYPMVVQLVGWRAVVMENKTAVQWVHQWAGLWAVLWEFHSVEQ